LSTPDQSKGRCNSQAPTKPDLVKESDADSFQRTEGKEFRRKESAGHNYLSGGGGVKKPVVTGVVKSKLLN